MQRPVMCYSASTLPALLLPPHNHVTDNVGVITKDSLLLTMNGETQHISVGAWYFVPAGTEHAAEFPEGTADIELWFKV